MEVHQPPAYLYSNLGLIPFLDAMELEHKLTKLISDEKSHDVLLILQHPPTVTMGKFGKPENVLIPLSELGEKGIAYYDSDRGGDATFNCPGQIIVHPIINLKHRGAKTYIADLNLMESSVLSSYGVEADKLAQHPGIWVNGKQIGAVGLRVSHGISMHGLSLNVNPDLSNFKVINLCGLPGKTATSIEAEIGHTVPIEEVTQRLILAFSEVFKVSLSEISVEQLRALCSIC